MPQQTVTRSIETAADPEKIFAFLVEIENIPMWAPVFADSIQRVDGSRCRAVKDSTTFELDVITNNVARTVDYIREMPGGRRGGAYIRVTPRPLGGSSVVMTVPVAANANPDDIGQVLEQELQSLAQLAGV